MRLRCTIEYAADNGSRQMHDKKDHIIDMLLMYRAKITDLIINIGVLYVAVQRETLGGLGTAGSSRPWSSGKFPSVQAGKQLMLSNKTVKHSNRAVSTMIRTIWSFSLLVHTQYWL